jgi:hypothetical protein
VSTGEVLTTTGTSSTMQLAGDSTRRLAAYVALAADTASVQARMAAQAHSLDDERAVLTQARAAAQNATLQASAALLKGDWLESMVKMDGSSDDVAGGLGYSHYWQIGRAKLDVARAKSNEAVSAADAALACSARSCSAAHVLHLQSSVDAAAGAAREAESVVRVAIARLR